MSTSCALKNTPYLDRPVRTMWQAARDLLDYGTSRRCEVTWRSGYRLWVLACASRAPGVPFQMTTYQASWMP